MTPDYLKLRYETQGSLPTIIKNFGREDFGQLFWECGFTQGAEIGVWQGEFTTSLCSANPNLHMLCIDPWVPYKEFYEPITTQMFSDAKTIARHVLSQLNCEIICEFSNIAALNVPDESLDFVYIDGNHSFFSVVEDLTIWSPKVKCGGIVSGHDYDVFQNQPQIQVVEAVDGFVTTHHIDPWFVTERKDVKNNAKSFLWVKT